ncbi:MAG TPA: hypothetical protein VLG38_08100 [Gammaproteobacteria bacterium]|nr:hypothetical protein [Gammaproteobacteria bacterium]
MKLKTWLEKRTKKLHWYDWVQVKWCAFFFGLFIAKVWPPILSLNWYWYLIIVVLLAIRPTCKFYCKK